MTTEKRKTGFATMTPAQLSEVSRAGGRAAHAKGTAHRWTSAEASVAGRKGGAATQERAKRQ